MGIVPGEDPGPRSEPPLLNEDPVPPGVDDLREDVDEIEKRARQAGPAEVERADREADAVEGEGDQDTGAGAGAEDQGAGEEPGSRSDADNDPTSDDPSTDTPA